MEHILNRFAAGWPRVIDCGQGWYPILIELDHQLAAIDPDYTIHQIKEKFGTLRFYSSADENPALREPVRDAERASASTCETCGTPGTYRDTKWWVRTLCDTHAKEYGYQPEGH